MSNIDEILESAQPYHEAIRLRERGFEEVATPFLDKGVETFFPKRGTAHSACYDFTAGKSFDVPAHGIAVIPTNIRAYMKQDEVLQIFVRSSIGIKKGLTIANGTGIIDSDYYRNPSNDGNIFIALRNNTAENIQINHGDKVAQGMFVKFLKADDDNSVEERTGGIGSTGK